MFAFFQCLHKYYIPAVVLLITIGDGLMPPPWCSLPLALSWSCCCGPYSPSRQWAGTTTIVFITCRCAGPAVMEFAMYMLLPRLWFHHISVGMVMPSRGSLHRHWAGPVVHQVYGVLVPLSRGSLPHCPGLPCWIWVHIRFSSLPLGSPLPHGQTTSPTKFTTWLPPPPHSQLHSGCCWLASGDSDTGIVVTCMWLMADNFWGWQITLH